MKSTEITNETSIFELFRKLSDDLPEVLIWTNSKNGLKGLISAKISKIDLARKVLFLVIDGNYLEISKKTIKLRDKIYIKTKTKGLFFEQKAINFEKNKLLVPFPKILKIHEQRRKERQVAGIKSRVKALIKNKTQAISTQTSPHFSFKLYDFTKTGISLLIPLNQSILFNINDKIEVIRFLEIKDNFTTTGIIKSLVKIENKENNIFKSYMKMGLTLKVPLSPKVIHLLQCELNNIKKADVG